MKVIAMIPARYSASRFPGKLMKDLGSKSVILRTYEATVETNLFSAVYVVTDSEIISDEIKNHGGNVIMSQKVHESGSDRIAEAVHNVDCDIVVNVQGDEPLVKSEQLNALVKAFSDESVEIATLAIEKTSKADFCNENRVKVVVDQNWNALYFSRSPIPKHPDNSGPISFLKHIGIYAFRRKSLLQMEAMKSAEIEELESLEQLRWMFNGKKIKVIKTTIETPNIDVPDDVRQVLKLL